MEILALSDENILTRLPELEIDKMCRTCLFSEGTLDISSAISTTRESKPEEIPVESKNENVVIHKIITACSQLSVSENDGLPQKLCQKCVWQAVIASTFLQKCTRADTLLRNYLGIASIKEEGRETSAQALVSSAATPNMCEVVMKTEPFNGDSRAKKNLSRRITKRPVRSKISTRKRRRVYSESSSVDSERFLSLDSDIKPDLPEHFLDNVAKLTDKQLEDLRELEDKLKAQDNENTQRNGDSLSLWRNRKHKAGPCKEDLGDPQKCSICKEVFTDLKKLSKHRKIHGKKKHQCSTCGNGFTTTRGLRIHMRLHTGEKPEVCGTCSRAFSDPRALRDHELAHSGEKPFQCEYCNKKFAQKKPMQFHLKTHTGERPYICDICGKSYIQPNNLVIHKRSHTGEKPFVCKVCNKAFTNGASLSLHMPVHTGVKDFICTICGKRMARSGELTIHMRTHTGEKPYKCALCPKAFIKSSSLQAHMPTHTGEKKYVCPVCGKRVAHAGKLTVHIRTHSTEKPLACPVCDKRFANSNYLKQHSKIHTGEKPFSCSVCSRAFSKARILSEHMRTHTGERPYVCLICGHGFAQSTTLKTHMKIHAIERHPATLPGGAFSALGASLNLPALPVPPERTNATDVGVSATTLRMMLAGPQAQTQTMQTIRRDDDANRNNGLAVISAQSQEYTMRPPMEIAPMTEVAPNSLPAQHPDHRTAFDPRIMGFLPYPL